MDVLINYYNRNCDTRSPIQKDYQRIVKHDEKGEEIITFEEFDAAKAQRSLGYCEDWSLENLLKAGINPDMNIHTGYNTRLEGISTMETMSAEAEKIINEETTKNNE